MTERPSLFQFTVFRAGGGKTILTYEEEIDCVGRLEEATEEEAEIVFKNIL